MSLIYRNLSIKYHILQKIWYLQYFFITISSIYMCCSPLQYRNQVPQLNSSHHHRTYPLLLCNDSFFTSFLPRLLLPRRISQRPMPRWSKEVVTWAQEFFLSTQFNELERDAWLLRMGRREMRRLRPRHRPRPLQGRHLRPDQRLFNPFQPHILVATTSPQVRFPTNSIVSQIWHTLICRSAVSWDRFHTPWLTSPT